MSRLPTPNLASKSGTNSNISTTTPEEPSADMKRRVKPVDGEIVSIFNEGAPLNRMFNYYIGNQSHTGTLRAANDTKPMAGWILKENHYHRGWFAIVSYEE